MCSPTEINPAAARLPASLQMPSPYRHAPDHRALSRGNPGARLPLLWRRPRPPAKNRTHLPHDALPHSMLLALGPDGSAPLPVTFQHLLGRTYPAPPPGRAYLQLKLLCRKLLIDEWQKAAPDPARYAYCPSLSPYPFMGLYKFDAGGLHQMRSGKSYIRAHPSCDDPTPTMCPSSKAVTETFEHAILYCSAKRPVRDCHLQGVTDVGRDVPVWSSAALQGVLTRFVRSTATAFPPGMFSRPSSSAESVSSRASSVVSFGYSLSSQES